MNDSEIGRYRKALRAKLEEIEADDGLGQDAQRVVALDQQSVGRLSRMDALQGQAMAKATAARRGASRTRILAALTRMEEGEFGFCIECGDEIAGARLDLDPAVPTCITCARG